MIRSVTAHTYEIDDVELAVSELCEQVRAVVSPDENMLGIVFCSYDFIESGVVKALAGESPFPIVGGTTVSQAVPGASGVLFLTLMVLYSDDGCCSFATGVTGALPEEGDITPFVSEAYAAAAAKLGEKGKLILAFPPLLLLKHSGDSYVRSLSNVSNHTPIFGTMVVDDSLNYENARVIYGGEAYTDRLPFAVLAGDFTPEFHVSTLSGESKELVQRAEITASSGSILHGVNDMPVVSYLESVGLASNGKIREGINSLRFLVHMKNAPDYDGVPITRAIYGMMPDGSASCAGEMPEGSAFTVGVCEKGEVDESAKEILAHIQENHAGRTALVFSCIGRRFALGGDPYLELRHCEALNGALSYMMVYSGGEVCPTSVRDGVATNRFHNYTLVACIL